MATAESDQQKIWLQEWRAGDQRAGARLVSAYQGLCMKWARKAQRMCPHLDVGEFYGAAQEGLALAMEKYDEKRSPSFARTAEVWVRARVFESAHRNRNAQFTIKTSRLEKRVMYGSTRALAAAAAQGLQGAEALAHAAQALRTTPEHLQAAMGVGHMGVVAHRPGEDDLQPVAVCEAPPVEEAMDVEARGRLLETLFKEAGLSDRDRMVLLARHADEFRSHDSIAQDLCLSRERVRKIQVEALDRLKAAAEKRGLDLSTLL